MESQEGRIHEEDQEEKLRQLLQKTGAKLEVIAGTPVFTVGLEHKDTALPQILDSFGDQTVLRIINGHFVTDAATFGTDRVHIDEHDFRSIIHYITGQGYGYDLWGVEAAARDMGLKAADAFCGTPYGYFYRQRPEGYSSNGLGVPNDRSALLIFDSNQLQKIETPGSDGYVFTHPESKKQALLGIVKFQEQLFEFEKALNAAGSLDDKISLLENEITQNMNTTDDLRKAFYIALNMVTLLRDESIKNANTPSAASADRIQKLKDAVEALKYETSMIATIRDYKLRIEAVREWIKKEKIQPTDMLTESDFFAKCRTITMPKRPGEIIESIQKLLGETTLTQKYRVQLEEVMGDAQKCKAELAELPVRDEDELRDLLKKTRGYIRINVNGN